MSARHLAALDYADYQANGILKKHAKNRPLGHIEQKHNYIPCQPVLSCRTVDIDLPGTRTYRPKSTVDILEEQQRLIRQLYNKQRAAVSAPPHQRTDPSIRTHPDNFRSVNIEVKGRPLTSLSSHVPSGKVDKILTVSQRRPRTTGRLKNIKPATDSFMVIKVDKDLVETSKNNRQLTNQIHSYWKSENHDLAVGKFVRGQKRPDDVPPTLDAWFTFGGAAGEESQGVIDAFTSFKNSEEYYNIEGSVGSRVAQQLKKGDKIRIGINGVLQTQDLKVKKWKKQNASENVSDELEEPKEEEVQETNIEEPEVVPETEEIEQQVDATDTAGADDDDDFKELRIDDDLDDLLNEDPVEEEKPVVAPTTSSRNSKSPVAASRKLSPVNDDMDKGRESSSPRETIPLSWDDQCHKTDVRVIHARPLTAKGKPNSMSETHPVKFERLISNGRRPKLCDQPLENGFKVKQRASTLKDKRDGRSSASKIKVVYIDPLNPEEDSKVDTMSVEEIINHQLNTRTSKGGGDAGGGYANAKTGHRPAADESGTAAAYNNGDTIFVPKPLKLGALKNNNHQQPRSNNNSRPSSNSSDRGITITSPKLKTIPVNSSHPPNANNTNLSITTPGARNSGPVSEIPRAGKSAGRISPSKSLHRSGAGSGSSIKSGPLPGEPEYIKITSQLIAGSPVPSGYSQSISYQSFAYQPGRNTPRGEPQSPVDPKMDIFSNYADVEFVKESFSHMMDYGGTDVTKDQAANEMPGQHNNINDNNNNNNNNIGNNDVDDDDDQNDRSLLSESPAPTTVAISIPTADELSDRDSPTNSPARQHLSDGEDDLTSMQKRERNMKKEHIDQLTDLLGGVIVDKENSQSQK